VDFLQSVPAWALLLVSFSVGVLGYQILRTMIVGVSRIEWPSAYIGWAAGLVLSVGLFFFGCANWYCACTPDIPKSPSAETIAQHNRTIEERRESMMIPFTASMPLTFVGLAGAIMCFVFVVETYDERKRPVRS
jgi:hypothetical protein